MLDNAFVNDIRSCDFLSYYDSFCCVQLFDGQLLIARVILIINGWTPLNYCIRGIIRYFVQNVQIGLYDIRVWFQNLVNIYLCRPNNRNPHTLTRVRLYIKMPFYQHKISIIKIRRSRGRLIIIMLIPIPWQKVFIFRQGPTYFESPLWTAAASFEYCCRWVGNGPCSRYIT